MKTDSKLGKEITRRLQAGEARDQILAWLDQRYPAGSRSAVARVASETSDRVDAPEGVNAVFLDRCIAAAAKEVA